MAKGVSFQHGSHLGYTEIRIPTEQELFELCWKNVRSLDPVKVEQAVAALREEIMAYADVEADLKARIAENREGWLGGRPDVPCPFCKATGIMRVPKDQFNFGKEIAYDDPEWDTKHEALLADPKLAVDKPCTGCNGKGRRHEFPLHHGWGTNIRNFLRKKGFGEPFFEIDNLDDYYSALVEMAMGFEGP